MAFANWCYVRPGSFGWYDDDGVNVTVEGSSAPTEAHFRGFDQPTGIRLVVHGARKGEVPTIRPELPYEAMADMHTVIQDDSAFRGWGSCKTVDGGDFCAYFESDDGINWRRPKLGVVEYRGSRANNFIESVHGTVFYDPAGPPEERYKAIGESYFSKDRLEAYCKRRPGDFDPKSLRTDIVDLKGMGYWWWKGGNVCGARGFFSPDGFRWTAIDEPLVVHHTDTQIVCYYDTRLRKYVAYWRDWAVGYRSELATDENVPRRWIAVGRRSIGRSETDDFRSFPLSELILEPRLDMRPTQVLYTNCKTTFPGAPDQHLMFPAVWDTADDTTSIELASSSDGRAWNYLPGTPVFDTSTFGEWDGGAIFAHPNLIELKDGSLALPYTGYNVPHKYPRGGWRGTSKYAPGYSIWPKGRMIAIEAPERGEFATVAVMPPARANRIRINALTKRAGFIKVEAARIDGSPIPGREFQNAVPLVGDCYKTPLVWKDHDDLGLERGQPLILRFRMEAARLYFVDFV
jgi:hypothetical protein